MTVPGTVSSCFLSRFLSTLRVVAVRAEFERSRTPDGASTRCDSTHGPLRRRHGSALALRTSSGLWQMVSAIASYFAFISSKASLPMSSLFGAHAFRTTSGRASVLGCPLWVAQEEQLSHLCPFLAACQSRPVQRVNVNANVVNDARDAARMRTTRIAHHEPLAH